MFSIIDTIGNDMSRYIQMFIDGTVITLPSIVAAIGIIVNNIKASSRQKRDRSIGFDLELIEALYERYDNVSKEYIEIVSSISFRLYNIQEEIIYHGTDNELQRYISEVQDFVKRSLFFALYKSKVIEMRRMGISSDELVHSIIDLSQDIVSYARTVSYTSKLYVVKYSDINDINLTREVVVEVLKSKCNFEKNSEHSTGVVEDYLREEEIKDFGRLVKQLSESEKRAISAEIKRIIREYETSINTETKFLDDYEEQINRALKRVIE